MGGPPAPTTGGGGGWMDNNFMGGGAATSAFTPQDLVQVLAASQPGTGGNAGVSINGGFSNESGTIQLVLNISNNNAQVLSDFQVQINRNSFGITASPTQVNPISPGQSSTVKFNCSITSENLDMSSPPTCPFKLQTAMKCSVDVFYFEVPCMLHNLLNGQAPAIDGG